MQVANLLHVQSKKFNYQVSSSLFDRPKSKRLWVASIRRKCV